MKIAKTNQSFGWFLLDTSQNNIFLQQVFCFNKLQNPQKIAILKSRYSKNANKIYLRLIFKFLEF